jgi:hypothetical protein
MEILFNTAFDREICETRSYAARIIGESCTELLHQCLAELRACRSFEIFSLADNGFACKLAANSWKIEVCNGLSLTVRNADRAVHATNEPVHATNVDWNRVRRIQVTSTLTESGHV